MGLEDIITVAMPDAVLVAHKDCAQDVKKAVAKLKQKGAEHWIVIEGSAKVTINDDFKTVTENKSVYIPLGAVHRLENLGKLPLTLIEVQTGSDIGEADIIRHDASTPMDSVLRGEHVAPLAKSSPV